jgi:phosphohistidine phosphatase
VLCSQLSVTHNLLNCLRNLFQIGPTYKTSHFVIVACRDWLAWALLQGSDAAPGGFMIPGEYSLAYRLITGWLQQQQQQQQQQQGLQEALQETAMEAGPNSSSSSSWLGNQVPQVEIDEGVFKYVLLRLTDSSSGRSKLLVRGAAAAAYHNHILQHTKGQLQKLCPQGTLQLDVLGGGRIEHYADHKVISVYGYSAAFGPAVHEVTAALLQRWYPFYDASSITWSYEGY